jgi:SAM-dependent methyltransferase
MASAAELQWWNRFADVMARQWNLTPTMNRAIRTEYERDYEEFLFQPGGSLLDVGCGTGVRTHGLARRGMQVDGIDFSASQLELARDLARRERIETMQFFRRDLVNDPWAGRRPVYDAAFVCALLHHLAYEEVDRVFERLAESVRPGGRVYLYEPLVVRRRSAFKAAGFWMLDFAWRAALGLWMRAGRRFGWFDPAFQQALCEGYTGTSPDEHAIVYDRLAHAAEREFRVLAVRPFHQYSLAFAMSAMLLTEQSRQRVERFAGVVYALEQRLFRLGMWENAGLEKRWILCAVKLERRAA